LPWLKIWRDRQTRSSDKKHALNLTTLQHPFPSGRGEGAPCALLQTQPLTPAPAGQGWQKTANSSMPRLNHRHDEFPDFTAPTNTQQHNPITLPYNSLQRILSKGLYSEQPNQTGLLVGSGWINTDLYPHLWSGQRKDKEERTHITRRGLLAGARGGGSAASQTHRSGYHHIPAHTLPCAALPKAPRCFVWVNKGRSRGKRGGFPERWAADAGEPGSLLSVFTLFNSCPLDRATSQAADNKAVAGNTAKHLPTPL